MYEKFYGFKENPFTITPDPKFFFPSPKHTEVLDSLIYTVTQRRGFAVITGEIGSGKTTICRTLLERLNPGTKAAMITNTYLSPKELLSYTLEELGVTFDGGEKSNLLSCLKKFLVEQLYLDFNVVLIIDEAQNLSLKVLEEIRMLSNLETEKKKMIQIILTGQPALKDKLASKELDQLRQRINVQYHIPPLNRINNERYINHRLEVASINGNRKVEFTPEAIDKIYDYSQGIPRVINMVCNNALLIGYVTEAAQITPQIIKEAIEEFQNEIKVDKPIVSLPEPKQSQLQAAETQLKQLNEQLNSNQERLTTKQSQLQETETKLKELNAQLEKVQKDLCLSESSLSEKQTELGALIEDVNQTRKELQELGEQKHKSQQEQEELNQARLKLKAQQQKEQEELFAKLESTRVELDRCQSDIAKRQSELNITQSLIGKKESQLQEQNQKLAAKEFQFQEAESKLKQLNEELKKAQEENTQLKLKQETVSSQLKVSLNLYESTIAGKQVELDRINKNLQSSQEALITNQSLVSQRKTELEEQNQKLADKQTQVQEAESQLKELNRELNRLQSQKEETQAEQAKFNQEWLKRQKEWQAKQEEASRQLQTTESKLNQLNEELKKLQEENKQFQLKQETVSSQLKASLNLYESTIAGKQVELDRINKNLQSSQRALNDTESKCHQKYSELEQVNLQLDDTDKKLRYLKELILEQTQESTKKIETKGLQLKEIEDNINQLNKELGQVKQEKQKLQAEEEKLRQTHLERQKEWKKKEEEFNLCESAIIQKQSELKELNRDLTQLKEELKNLQEQKIKCQQGQEKLNQAWLGHQLAWQQKEKEILGEFKFTPISKTAEGEAFKSSIDKPIIKLKPKKPKTNAVVLAASHLRGEIKIDPIGNDDFLSSVYSGIRIFHRNGDMGNYKNFIFSAKGDKKRDYSTVFRVELNNNGSMKVGKHHSVRVTDSWQKFNIPLEDFSRMINLNIITEIAIFLDAITEADDITYIKDICFSNI